MFDSNNNNQNNNVQNQGPIDNSPNPYSIKNILGGDKSRPMTQEEIKRKRMIITVVISFFAIYFILAMVASVISLTSAFTSEMSLSPIPLIKTCLTGGFASMLITILTFLLVPKAAGGVASLIVKSDESKPYVDELNRLVVPGGAEGQSEIMREDELKSVFTICNPEDVIGHGYIVGIKKDTGQAICKERGRADFRNHLSNENAGAFGPSGTGKSTNCLLPNVLNSAASGEAMVIFDPKGAVYRDSKGILLAQGYKVWTFIVKANQIMHSDGWDCLRLIREAENPEPLAEMFSETLLKNVGGSDTPYWGPANHGLLTLCILYVAKAKGFIPVNLGASAKDGSVGDNFDSKRTFDEVVNLFTSPVKETQKQIKEAIDSSEYDKRLLNAKYTTWSGGDHTEQITSGLANSLSRFTTQTVSEILSSDEIRFEDLQEKTAIFIISDADEDTYRALSALFINSLLYRMKELAEQNVSQSLDRLLQIYIDELPSIGRVPGLENYMKTIRSYNMGIYYICQSIDDLYDVYGEGGKSTAWVGLLENTPLQLCLGANADTSGTNTKNYFSRRSGTVTTRTTSTSMDTVTYVPHSVQEIFNTQRGERTSDKGVPVYPPDAISKIKPDQMLISPATHNSVIEGKYFWKNHPLYDTVLIDKETGKEAEFIPAKHVPPRRGGDEDNMDRYIVATRSELKNAPKREEIKPSSNYEEDESDYL